MLARANIIIPEEFHVDIQDLFKSEEKFDYTPPYDRDGMGFLATSIIDIACGKLKNDFPLNGHQFWEKKPLSALHIEYAARDGYYSYDLYRRILIVKDGLSRGARKAEIVAAEAAAAAAAAEAAAADEAAAAADEAAEDEAVEDEAATDEAAADAMAVEAAEPSATSKKRSWDSLDKDGDDNNEHTAATGWK